MDYPTYYQGVELYLVDCVTLADARSGGVSGVQTLSVSDVGGGLKRTSQPEDDSLQGKLMGLNKSSRTIVHVPWYCSVAVNRPPVAVRQASVFTTCCRASSPCLSVLWDMVVE